MHNLAVSLHPAGAVCLLLWWKSRRLVTLRQPNQWRVALIKEVGLRDSSLALHQATYKILKWHRGRQWSQNGGVGGHKKTNKKKKHAPEGTHCSGRESEGRRKKTEMEEEEKTIPTWGGRRAHVLCKQLYFTRSDVSTLHVFCVRISILFHSASRRSRGDAPVHPVSPPDPNTATRFLDCLVLLLALRLNIKLY